MACYLPKTPQKVYFLAKRFVSIYPIATFVRLTQNDQEPSYPTLTIQEHHRRTTFTLFPATEKFNQSPSSADLICNNTEALQSLDSPGKL